MPTRPNVPAFLSSTLAGLPVLEERLHDLTAWLEARRPLWTTRPFLEMPPPWEADLPEVGRWLRGLPEEAVDALEADPTDLPPDAPAALHAWRAEAAPLEALPVLDVAPPPGLADPRLKFYVKGRKWRQIEAFVGAVLPHLAPGVDHFVDWCAGYGHLGRTLADVTGLEAVLVERDPALCQEGRRLADRLGVPYRYVEADAASPEAAAALGEGTAAVALHACGALADTLLAQAMAQETTFLAAAFCCYHRVEDRPRYRPRSAAGRARDLNLAPHLLRLPIYDEVVALPRVKRARRREMAFRAGFDLLVREASGEDRYTSPGNLSVADLKVPFAAFCEAMARRAGRPLPARWDASAAEAAGWERAREARSLGTVRAAFRRPLEVWLALDRALWLAEAGRPTGLAIFCPRHVTPRNILLLSEAAG